MRIGFFNLEDLHLVAERCVHDYGLDVIEPRWRTDGEQDFDLLARDGNVLVGVHVLIAPRGSSTSDVTYLDDDQTGQIHEAVRAWMHHHAFALERTRLDVLALIPMLDDLIGVQYDEGA